LTPTTLYATNGPLTNTTTNWTNLSTVVYLQGGTNVMTLHCLTNATNSSNVGRFNYISIYPWWQAGVTNISGSNTVTLVTNTVPGPLTLIAGTSNPWFNATNNAMVIQGAVTSLIPTGGGEVLLPPGTFLTAQSSPNESNNSYLNAAVSILGNNIEISGAGNTITTLIAYNRATTIFCLGYNGITNPQCVNFTLSGMTIEAQPHRAVTNGTSTVYSPSQLNPTNGGGDGSAGALTVVYGYGPGFSYNILFTNCQFLYGDRSIEMFGSVSNVMVQGCSFIPWGGLDTWGDLNTYAPGMTTYQGQVAFWSRAISYNLVAIGNFYNGNSLITATNTTNMGPDGFVWFQNCGNDFVARNTISNNALEGVNLGAGPTAVVGNTYGTLILSGSTCALCAAGGNIGPTTNVALNNSTCFSGNFVNGGRQGESAQGESYGSPYTINFSGNYLTLYPSYDEWNDYPGAVVAVETCTAANVCGNTLVSGPVGFMFYPGCTNALILANNFSNVTYRGIGYALGGGSVQSASVFNNIIGQGVSFHVELPYTNSFGWFLDQNTYVGTNGAVVPPFCDPASSSVHIAY
jgi:hypothetical protein